MRAVEPVDKLAALNLSRRQRKLGSTPTNLFQKEIHTNKSDKKGSLSFLNSINIVDVY